MRYKLTWLESKNKDWKVATLELPTGEKFEEVSINRVGKKGDVFPNFDSLILGGDVVGELWQSQTQINKWYLFPPRPDKPQGGGNSRATGAKGGAVEAAKITKESVSKAQDRNEGGYKTSATFRDATILTQLFLQGKDPTRSDIEAEWKYWRKFGLDNWDTTPKSPTDLDEPPMI